VAQTGIPPQWINSSLKTKYKRANEPTALTYISRELAVRIFAEGAQAASYALCNAKLMNTEQRSQLQNFILDLSHQQAT
jgi:hypothetical protein